MNQQEMLVRSLFGSPEPQFAQGTAQANFRRHLVSSMTAQLDCLGEALDIALDLGMNDECKELFAACELIEEWWDRNIHSI